MAGNPPIKRKKKVGTIQVITNLNNTNIKRNSNARSCKEIHLT